MAGGGEPIGGCHTDDAGPDDDCFFVFLRHFLTQIIEI
jgi:hypothetical protein